MQNRLISDKHARSHSTPYYAIVSQRQFLKYEFETSVVTFFVSSIFLFLLDFLNGKGVDIAHCGQTNGCIFGGNARLGGLVENRLPYASVHVCFQFSKRLKL